MIGFLLVYVDDFLALLHPEVREAVLAAVRALWTTSEPVTLGRNGVREITFLGLDIAIPDSVTQLSEQPAHIVLHQTRYAHDVVDRFAASPLRSRVSPGESVSFSASTKYSKEVIPPSADPQKHRLMQQINGAILWLVTRTRPDMAWALSVFSTVLARDLREAEERAKHLLQYLSSHPACHGPIRSKRPIRPTPCRGESE